MYQNDPSPHAFCKMPVKIVLFIRRFPFTDAENTRSPKFDGTEGPTPQCATLEASGSKVARRERALENHFTYLQ